MQMHATLIDAFVIVLFQVDAIKTRIDEQLPAYKGDSWGACNRSNRPAIGYITESPFAEVLGLFLMAVVHLRRTGICEWQVCAHAAPFCRI